MNKLRFFLYNRSFLTTLLRKATENPAPPTAFTDIISETAQRRPAQFKACEETTFSTLDRIPTRWKKFSIAMEKEFQRLGKYFPPRWNFCSTAVKKNFHRGGIGPTAGKRNKSSELRDFVLPLQAISLNLGKSA